MNMSNIGVAGEARFVVLRADGTVKSDTGYQKNLILNQGLEYFGGGIGGDINEKCVIGAGNSAPAVTQTTLDSFIAIATGTDTTKDYSYTDTGDGLYKIWEQRKYRFTGLGNVNISEAGLASKGSTSSDYYLTTRVLIKDELGAPTSMGLKLGETLDIYYKLYKVIDTTDKSFVVNVSDGQDIPTLTPYNVVIRPALVGTSNHRVSGGIKTVPYVKIGTDDLEAITSEPVVNNSEGMMTAETYVVGSHKCKLVVNFGLNNSNVAIRTLSPTYAGYVFNLFPFQMRLGRVSDDAPLTKTNKDTLAIPLEVSWRRFEGEL
ncbi:hypothetical protein [uncultured Psychrobacter sp.]|uniref:hypothetical protein n=1 Tax=uncultured Psychrobacter sp. TaxID=259303 RepID=UPI0032B26F7A|tara:strand:- start:2450 stop:3403 length:954 start_codon:yes stop_codon:yes gene_type:complete